MLFHLRSGLSESQSFVATCFLKNVANPLSRTVCRRLSFACRTLTVVFFGPLSLVATFSKGAQRFQNAGETAAPIAHDCFLCSIIEKNCVATFRLHRSSSIKQRPRRTRGFEVVRTSRCGQLGVLTCLLEILKQSKAV